MDGEQEQSNIDRVRDALEAAGLHTWELGDGIVNVHSEPVTSDGSDDAKSYLFTVTVTTTP